MTYDSWKTTPPDGPDDEPETETFRCEKCGEEYVIDELVDWVNMWCEGCYHYWKEGEDDCLRILYESEPEGLFHD